MGNFFGSQKGYWLGPYDIRVPNNIEYIISSDGGNTRYKNGGETEMCVMTPLTRDEYLDKFTVLKDDGFYYWKI